MDDLIPNRIVIGITGASGAPYAMRVIELLTEADVEVHVALTALGRRLLFDEVGMRVHHAQYFDDAFNLAQITQHLFQNSELIDCCQTSALVAFFDADARAEFSCYLAAVSSFWSFASKKYQVAGSDTIDVVGDRAGRCWQFNAELAKSRFRVIDIFPSAILSVG